MSDNFIECANVEDANKIDLDIYSFHRYSESRGYIFVKRRKR